MADLVTDAPSPRAPIPGAGARSKTRDARVIELLGTPGSGKSTVAAVLEDVLTETGAVPYRPVEAARPFARRTAPGRLAARLLDGRWLARVLWAIYLAYSWGHAAVFALRNPRLIRHVVASQGGRPDAADVKERRVLYWYFRMIGSHGFLVERGHSGEVLIFDEGFVHRVVQLYASEVEDPAPESIGTYLNLIPEPDLIIHVSAPTELCIERIKTRGVWDRYRSGGSESLADFVKSAGRAVELAAAGIQQRGWRMATLENHRDPGTIRPQLERILSSPTETAWLPARRSSPLYTIYLPTPGRLREVAEAARRPPVVDEEDARRVLSQFGLEPDGKISNLPMGWRNRNVLVRTDRGLKVLRRYPERWTEEAILFEHSILDRLATLDFPAPRLTVGPSGETVVRDSDSNWAVYDYVSGSNLGACLIRPSERARLTYLAGEALAAFHRAMAGFAPRGRHHLGFQSDGAGDSLDLSGYQQTLREMAEAPIDSDMAIVPPGRASAAAGRMSALSEVIDGSPVEKTVIHGDFGLHNLLFRRDGLAAVLDFELSRVEWRLVDLVRVLSRQKRYAGRAFLSGYREASGIEVEEFGLLPEVWELYRLMGAVRSWRMGRDMGDPARLATARRRFEEADWISANRLAPWGLSSK